MKGIKGRFLKRFRSIPTIYTSKQNEYREKISSDHQNLPNHIQQQHSTITSLDLIEEKLESRLCQYEDIISADQLASNNKEIDIFEECECEFDSIPEMESCSSASSSSPISSTHSDSNIDEALQTTFQVLEENPIGGSKDLLEFDEKCPPGGSDKVILYTTSLRGIRKTYEDCHTIKFLLESLRVVYFERDVSMHLEFRDELWGILGERIIPPRLFIKGRHIGGADEVFTLNERGMLKKLLQGIPVVASACNLKCSLCCGIRFLLCTDCNGSCKIYKGDQGNGGNFSRCLKCNENGLVKCPTCS